jgi:hypothetical protein
MLQPTSDRRKLVLTPAQEYKYGPWLLRRPVITNVAQTQTESTGLSQKNITRPTLVIGWQPLGRVTDYRQGLAVLLSTPT